MLRLKLATLGAAVVIIAGTAPAAAQKYRMDLGANGGASWYSHSLTASDIGSDVGGLKFAPNWLLGAQTTVWLPRMLFIPRVGVRANFGYTDTDLEQVVSSGTNTLLHGDINLWSGTGDILLGMKAPRETWSGPEFLPYLALGFGMKWVNPAGSDARLTNSTDGVESSGIPITCLAGTCTATTSNPPGGTGTGVLTGRTSYFLSDDKGPMLLAGLGGDVRFAPSFALRIEGGDRIWKAPFQRTDPPTAQFPNITTADDSRVGNLMNELYLQAGLHMLVGLSRPAVLAILPAPQAAPKVEMVMPQPVAMTLPVRKSESNDDAARLRAEDELRRREEADRTMNVLKERVNFAYDESDLSNVAKRTLDAKIVILNGNPDVRLMIEGYADERGTVRYNQVLGLRRANALRDYLSAAGLATTRLDVISYGKQRPLSSGTSEADYAQNRRGEFTVLGHLVQSQQQQ